MIAIRSTAAAYVTYAFTSLLLVRGGGTELCSADICAEAAEFGEVSFVQLRRHTSDAPSIGTPVNHNDDRKNHEQRAGNGKANNNLLDFMFYIPLDLPNAGRHCQGGYLDCLDVSKRRRCPQACEIQDEMLDLMSTQRSHLVPKLRTRLVSRLQSKFERAALSSFGARLQACQDGTTSR